jgi:hypothetical protein
MATYNYSLSADFSNGICECFLHQQIVDEQAITTTLDGVNVKGDDVGIVFDGTLSTEEETALDAVVAAHDPDDAPCSEYGSAPKGPIVSPCGEGTASQSWVTLDRFEFQGTDEYGRVNAITCYVDNQSAIKTSAVQLIDQDNGDAVMASIASIDCNGEGIVDLTVSQANIPTSRCRIAVQGKCNDADHQMYLLSTVIHP